MKSYYTVGLSLGLVVAGCNPHQLKPNKQVELALDAHVLLPPRVAPPTRLEAPTPKALSFDQRPRVVSASFAALSQSVRQQAQQYTSDRQGSEPPPLSLTASDGTGLELVSVTARAAVEGPLALTELHLTFRNPQPRVIEGRFAITLPPAATISRLAMRLPAGWQEAEVVERQAARKAYEDFLHRKQDPALLEKKAGNQFRARIFPIAARADKEIKIAYSQQLRSARYRLPLVGLPRMQQLEIAVVDRSGEIARVEQRDIRPTRDLVVGTGREASGLRHANLVVGRVTPRISTELLSIRGLLVLFDTSASRAPAFAHAVEGLGALIATLRERHGDSVQLQVVCFDQVISPVFGGRIGAFDERALQRIRGRRALGASNLMAALRWARDRGAGYERVLLITDGVATAGEDDGASLHRAARQLGAERIDAVVVGGIRDEATLARLVRGTARRDGTILDAGQGVSAIARRLSQHTVSGIEVDVPGARWVWPSQLTGVQPGDSFLIYADLPREGEAMTVNLSGPTKQALRVPLSPAKRPLLERAWVGAAIARMLDDRDRAGYGPQQRAAVNKKIIELSTRYRVLTDLTALLVLETERDYARFGIERRALADILAVGPSGVTLLQRSGAVYGKQKQQRREREKREEEDALAAGAAATPARAVPSRDRQARASARRRRPAFKPSVRRPPPARAAAASRRPRRKRDSLDSLIDGALGGDRRRPAAAPAARRSSRRLSRVQVMGRRHARRATNERLDALLLHERGPACRDSAEAYSGQMSTIMRSIRRREHEKATLAALRWRMDKPGDVLALVALGRALAAQKQLRLAARAFGSIIDLYPSRADLRRFAGELLEALGDEAQPLAADTYAKAVLQRPDHLHGHRLLAYALVRLGEHEAAFSALAAGLKRRYPAGRFRGGRLILRQDLGLVGAAWAREAPQRTDEIDRRLHLLGASRPLQPSLRFVLYWETDANDVDFHIFDGRGGHAFFQDRRLSSGGSLYADVTDGYGPECFTINGPPRAFPYDLQIHYYSRGPMGYGMGKLEIVYHDGDGELTFDQRPYVVMNDRAFVDLGRVSWRRQWDQPWITRPRKYTKDHPVSSARCRRLPPNTHRLTRNEIQQGMRRIKARVQACYDKFRVTGLANVQVRISSSGRISSAKTTGIFAGTPTGACVLAAVRSARFPAGAEPITITYPFVLR